ncbi:MAG: hypothetical protein HZA02_06815 [Nitrospinae bacterium]|nr:hypothetical protein [Nitrospinota bacterium]
MNKALGTWHYAKSFFEAGQIIKEYTEDKTSLLSPAYYLYGHAIELVLKSYLQTKGQSIDNLKKLGHDLKKILNEADLLGLKDICALGTEESEAIKTINPYYKGKEFEYLVTGFKSFPNLDFLHTATDTLLSKIGKHFRKKLLNK